MSSDFFGQLQQCADSGCAQKEVRELNRDIPVPLDGLMVSLVAFVMGMFGDGGSLSRAIGFSAAIGATHGLFHSIIVKEEY